MKITELMEGCLLRQTSFDEVVPPCDPHGIFRQQFNEMQSVAMEGDVLYWYTSSRKDWQNGMGSEGYVLVRGNEIIGDLVLRMN